MKLKTALTLSLIVNTILLVAVGYVNATSMIPDSTPPLFIYTTNAPPVQVGSMAAVAH